jgi:hypothetical protein
VALECSFSALSSLDLADPLAIEALRDRCVAMLLDPTLWAWAIGLNLAFAVIGALVGTWRGRWLAGFVWGLALGPVGWVVAALLPRRDVARRGADCAGQHAPPSGRAILERPPAGRSHEQHETSRTPPPSS